MRAVHHNRPCNSQGKSLSLFAVDQKSRRVASNDAEMQRWHAIEASPAEIERHTIHLLRRARPGGWERRIPTARSRIGRSSPQAGIGVQPTLSTQTPCEELMPGAWGGASFRR